ncbi:MAG: hypothetical protein V7L22_07910 [Nostoc sp.]|uniref:hypothetical protein n=1 Tax=Nostoc sp. TaxID=1180 RepID=UPI002FF6151F
MPTFNHWHYWEVRGLGFTFTHLYLILTHSLADLDGFLQEHPKSFEFLRFLPDYNQEKGNGVGGKGK